MVATVADALGGKEKELERGMVAGWKMLKELPMQYMGEVGRAWKEVNEVFRNELFPSEEDLDGERAGGYDLCEFLILMWEFYRLHASF